MRNLLPFSRPADRHEAWFAQHYDVLVGWAWQITGRDREQAEDLVHDLFVLFMTTRPPLDGLENVNGYLYTSLRNLHLSNARRAARRREMVVAYGDFDVLEHESLRTSLRALHEQHAADVREQFRHQLRAVWRYAQARKHSSKAASVLTLRFFHGFHPDEIALILRTSRQAAYQLLRQARKEARLFLDGDLQVAPDAAATRDWPGGLLDPPDLALALHEATLRSDPDGICLTGPEIQRLYPVSDEGTSVPVTTLAHIVSCRECLSAITRRLDLPPLADRHPLDHLGYGPDVKPPRDASGGGAGGSAGSGRFGGAASGGAGRSRTRQRLAAGRRRLDDLLAHAPKELRVSVNGVILSNQHVTSPTNRFTLRLTTPDPNFVELFSEQDVRLLLVNLEAPPNGPVEVRQSIALGDGRRLDVRVSFADATPVAHVSYLDPAPILDPAPMQNEAAVRAPTPAVPTSPPASPSPSRARRLRDAALRLLRPRISPVRWRLSRRGAFMTLVAATAIAAILLNQLGRPVLSAAELLKKSSAAEAVWRADITRAVHRTLEVDVRTRETGTTTRRRVDVWQSAARGLTVRRAYDERNQLLASEWIRADGTRTIQHAAADAARAVGPLVGGLEAWQLGPSASDFARLIGDLDRASAVREGDRFRISFENAAAPAGPAVLSASLILRDDWRAVEQRATVRSADGTTDITWIERLWTMQPGAEVPATIFDLDARLSGRAAPDAASVVVPPATAGLEIAAFTALRRIDADLGEEVRVHRVDGRLHVTGVVASAERRQEIRSALAAVLANPAVRLRIETVDEAHARASRGMAAATPLEPDAARAPQVSGPRQIPTHAPIQAYLEAAGTPNPKPEDIVRVANGVVRQATRLRVHAWALRTLLEQLSAADVAQLDVDARRQWSALIGAHGRGFVAEAGALRAMMAPVFLADVRPATRPGGQVRLADAQVRETAAQFIDEAAELDRQILGGFTMPGAGAMPSFDAARFWDTFAHAVTLATAFDHSTEPALRNQP